MMVFNEYKDQMYLREISGMTYQMGIEDCFIKA